ncbi:protein Ilm1p [[Candida] jaroonii]|uniref:Protein Ilm1p n=1 Tax=[Candida] jaroonii TaxID=467808 RepID=A0ACA9Y4M5_9ASCO|nr:protein Ilm1p [[Candida] jaroonii]
MLTDAKSLIHSNFILLLGQAMNLPSIPIEDKPINGIISLLLFLQGVHDLIPNLADNIHYFETIVPTRLFFYFCLGAYCYLFEDEYFSNNVIFVYSFLEIWVNFLIYNNLRDEKFHRLKEYINEHGEELQNSENDKVRVIED